MRLRDAQTLCADFSDQARLGIGEDRARLIRVRAHPDRGSRGAVGDLHGQRAEMFGVELKLQMALLAGGLADIARELIEPLVATRQVEMTGDALIRLARPCGCAI